ncbi:hypothetical protein L226DRAFT_557381 [Lentinus tigrinus ALCF2SS1-7]|uniref:uncharacterized protein n=1 Tax=Lentinus tigrinus ALCF2SS1-7 TaxID=1328758 RepID=UPI001165D60E|nr:hypothetical protein L226DRAFT_557381 [Lentinus tigrinus ALCF2SS1-7]
MSPSSSTQQPHGVKRKKPPTFQHLPAERAKKLKRSWVEVQKIKSKWKAQKRKEGLVAPRAQLDLVTDADEDKDARDSREQGSEEDVGSISGPSDVDEGSESGEDSEEESGDESAESSSGDEAPPKASTSSQVRKHKGVSRKNTDEQQQPSLRDLQRMAYSKEALHREGEVVEEVDAMVDVVVDAADNEGAGADEDSRTWAYA